jgi:hypothetical protein
MFTATVNYSFRLLKYSLRRINLDNIVVFHKLAALSSSVVPHERTNATTEALVEAFYCCKLIVATFLFVTLLCSSRITMPKAAYRWKGKIMTKSTYEKRHAEQKTRCSLRHSTLQLFPTLPHFCSE